jgi:glycerol dehydrogenase-like iron-containing ADH family enzyme
LGFDPADAKLLRKTAYMSCMPGSTMHNMLFEVTPDDVYGALRRADALADVISIVSL